MGQRHPKGRTQAAVAVRVEKLGIGKAVTYLLERVRELRGPGNKVAVRKVRHRNGNNIERYGGAPFAIQRTVLRIGRKTYG